MAFFSFAANVLSMLGAGRGVSARVGRVRVSEAAWHLESMPANDKGRSVTSKLQGRANYF